MAAFCRLTYLDLSSNSFSGAIPRSLGLLRNLTYLSVSSNALQGPLPTELGDLRLQTLSVSGNSLTGSVPARLGDPALALTNNPTDGNGVFILLSGNQFSGPLPPGLLVYLGVALYRLDVSSNLLSGTIPAEIGRCTGLTQLDLSKNLFSGRPPYPQSSARAPSNSWT